jgi:hypothetical protein
MKELIKVKMKKDKGRIELQMNWKKIGLLNHYQIESR